MESDSPQAVVATDIPVCRLQGVDQIPHSNCGTQGDRLGFLVCVYFTSNLGTQGNLPGILPYWLDKDREDCARQLLLYTDVTHLFPVSAL